jgi:dual specificity tyrosine-phosphorylation-regulated kinase 2/3/4
VQADSLSPIVPNAPISPETAISQYSPLLTRTEMSEIVNFPEVFFLGERSRKADASPLCRLNHGFDHPDHSYRAQVGDHLAYRFEIRGFIGSGAFGRVVRAFDHKTQMDVAVKILVNTPQMHEQGQIEMQILGELNHRDCPWIVRAFDFFVFRSHICIVFEILSGSLYDVMKSDGFARTTAVLVRRYATQLLEALAVCHQAGIVHCDVKPDNVLYVNETRTAVKLIDFGSGCFDGSQRYPYIQSRFYRAPEVVLGIKYGPPTDIWGFGLIVVELLTGKILFPADDELELLGMMVEVIGLPPLAMIAASSRKAEFFDKQMNLKIAHANVRRPFSLSLTRILGSQNPQLHDFLKRCLAWDPAKRMSAHEALEHPWLRQREGIRIEKPEMSFPPIR